MASCTSHSPADTEALGESWGREATRGMVIGLCGDLGAGKTQLVRGIARGLGATNQVHSPTFSLVNIYQGGRLTLFHLDLYRLDSPEQIAAAGLEDYLQTDGLTAVEWMDKWLGRDEKGSLRIQDFLRTRGQYFRWAQIETLNATERRITYEDFGA